MLDAIELAVFVGIGVNKAFARGAVPLIAGVITGVGGGMLRDVLARGRSRLSCAPKFTLPPAMQAVLCTVHTVTYSEWHCLLKHATMLGMATTLLIRLAAIR